MSIKHANRLLCGTAFLAIIATGSLAQPIAQPECDLANGVLPDNCVRPNERTAVTMPVGENTELDDQVPQGGAGFQILIDGRPLAADSQVADVARMTDLALEEADIQISFDGLAARPRLDLQRSSASEPLEGGDTVTLTSRLNYPAYVTRGELRIIDRAGRGLNGRTLLVTPLAPNGQATITLPDGEDLVAVHRVYDARGRYDETVGIPVTKADRRGLSDLAEEGTDTTARSSIPVRGGAVTVSGQNVAASGTVYTLGEAVRPDPDGDFVLQRIMPVGEHAIDVRVAAPGQTLAFSRDIEIPRYDLFYTAMTDATIGVNRRGNRRETYSRGRLAFYANGYDSQGVEYTVAADTRDGDIKDLFSQFDDKDPSSLLRRIDPNEFYPTYGDGSTIVQDAPTQGKFYARVEKDESYVVWGNSRAELENSEYLRNDRTLYGLNAHWEAEEQTAAGEPRRQATFYAARPDNLPQRDVLRGTGGSTYFLSRQDITRGSETISVELRDPTTGRVIERRTLVPGTDYVVNHLQGSVRLASPLSASTGGGVVVTDPGGEGELNLVVQYEYTPTDLSVEGASVGGRVEGWATDDLRVGASAQHDDTGIAEQSAVGTDLRYQLGETSFVEAEYARSDGPGFGYRTSLDGGLIFDGTDPVGGTGAAGRLKAEIDLQELGSGTDGLITAYYENRDAGFTSLDYTVATGERLWGFTADVEATDRLTWRAYYDSFANDLGQRDREGGAEVHYEQNAANTWALGVEHIGRRTLRETGNRTDVALRYTRQVSKALSWSLLGQATVARQGLSRNNRLGLGVERDFGNGWTLAGEVSDGSLGAGADARAIYEREDGSSLYFGYEFDPDSFDRRGATDSLSDSRGKFVSGGRRQVSDTTAFYGETGYEIFGDRRALTSSYGVDYAPDDFLTYTVALDVGRIEDDIRSDFHRQAISWGTKYKDEQLTASGRAEYRRERGEATSADATDRDADTFLVTMNATYKLDASRTVLAYVDYANTDTDESSIRDGRLTDVVLGYAVRPVENDRFNMLFKYRYYYDMYGQTVDGTDTRGPRQLSHILTADAEYDLDRQWSIGGKIGARLSRAAGPAGGFYDNDAWLAVANARYHVVHNWDMLFEVRTLHQRQAEATDVGILAAAYRHFGNNMEVGVGYNFGKFSDDLADLTQDDKGAFINAIASF